MMDDSSPVGEDSLVPQADKQFLVNRQLRVNP